MAPKAVINSNGHARNGNGHAMNGNGSVVEVGDIRSSWFAEVLETIDVMVPLQLTDGVPAIVDKENSGVTQAYTAI
jgi:hypothetical protein